MKKLAGIGITLVLTLSACVPIPQQAPLDPPPDSVPKPKVEVPALARAFAGAYRVDNVDRIHSSLAELEECIRGEVVADQTIEPEEVDALVVYLVGFFHMAAMATRFDDIESGKLDSLYDPDTESQEEQLVQQLAWATTFCYEGD